MAVPVRSTLIHRRVLPVVSLERTAVALFIVALTVASLPWGLPPTGPVIWAWAVIGGFVLSAATGIAAQVRKHRVVRTPLGYWALAFLILSAAILAAAAAIFSPGTQLPLTPDIFISAVTIALTAAAVLFILAAFRADGAGTRFLPTTPMGWWAAAFLVVGLFLNFSPWAVLTPAAGAAPALALAAIISYGDRSILPVIALVAGPAQMALVDLTFFLSTFTPHP